MAFSEELAERIRGVLDGDARISERKMFGGLCFMCSGNMAAGIVGDELMVRVGPAGYTDALAHQHARVMDFTGRVMKGFVQVGVEGLATDDELTGWLDRGLCFAGSLPPK